MDPQKWKYKSAQQPSDEDLNSLGAEGWELVAINAAEDMFIFKRPAAPLG
jgi:hypothetical protein